ncbi:MAG TPA: YciI family protein [Jatrophihabitantaceae bacterium]|jgi:hypothetical protein
MQYAVLIYETPGMLDGVDAAQREQITAEYMTLRADPACLDGAKLAPADSATTVRVASGDALVTDGPFANTKEVFGGYYIFEADDLDAALAWAARIPAARLGGSAEVRPVVFRAPIGEPS